MQNLSFRQPKATKKNLYRGLLLLAVFIVFVIIFEITTNIEKDNTFSVDNSSTLPIINVNLKSNYSTTLYGYKTQMNPCYMRDALVPLDSTRSISLSITDYKDFNVSNISYEVRSLDTQRKIASNTLDYTTESNALSVNLKIENLIDKGEEYLLIITITSENDEKLYYYTRILYTDNYNEYNCLSFAMDFHNTALSDNVSSISNLIEPLPANDTRTLRHVTINSSLSQINYGSFDGQVVGTPTVAFNDITDTHTALTLYFLMSSGSGKDTEYYQVKEYFRVRYTSERIYLLDYDRTMELLLDQRNAKFIDNNLMLGITNEDNQYLSNETGTVVGFVQSGELFLYNQTKRQLNCVFSFVNGNYNDKRNLYDQHSITILNIDESGTMDYVVYGYMNNGIHEGQCGIDLYHYDSLTDTSVEQVFISSPNSYQILNANFSDLMYETSNNEFYILVSGTLLKMDLKKLTTEELMTNIKDSQYVASASGRYLAYIDELEVSDKINIIDLETGKKTSIKCKSGTKIKPVTFMEDDLVYGIIKDENIINDGAGTTRYAMHKLVITNVSSNNETLMEYSKKGFYVTDVNLVGYTLYLNRVTIENNTLFEAPLDTIMNSSGEQNKAVSLNTITDDIKGSVIALSMAPLDEDTVLGKVKRENGKILVSDMSKEISIKEENNENRYFVYIGSNVIMSTDNLTSAISVADEQMGIVINNSQKYIWNRGKKAYRNALSGLSVGTGDLDAPGQAKALSAMLVREGENVQVHALLEHGSTPISILEKTLNVTALDLTGCSLSEVLYYVSNDTPVYAKNGLDTAVLIVGYEPSTIVIYDPITDSRQRIGMTAATELFESVGNVFISYVK